MFARYTLISITNSTCKLFLSKPYSYTLTIISEIKMSKWLPPSLLSQSFLLSVWQLKLQQKTLSSSHILIPWSFTPSGTTDHNCKINVHLYVLFNILNGIKLLSFEVYYICIFLTAASSKYLRHCRLYLVKNIRFSKETSLKKIYIFW